MISHIKEDSGKKHSKLLEQHALIYQSKWNLLEIA
ncbi:MAG: hypothetical protein ACJAXJ_003076 [Colwellia sp.]|jgi:hypothetical protein